MKSKSEQLDFANKLKELTDYNTELVTKLSSVTDTAERLNLLTEINSVLEQMSELRNSYMQDSL